jgi:cation diffusion facilitator family transporter
MDRAEKIVLLAIAVHLLLFGLKFVFAALSGSIGLKAEAFDSLADVVASAAVLGGLKIAKRKTEMFPYGLYKVENLVSVMVALAIFYAGYRIVREAVEGGRDELTNVGLAIASVLAAIIIIYAFSRYEARVGREMNSPALMADAEHISIDLFAHGVVLMGLLSSLVGIDLDRIAAFVIAVFIFWAGVKILVSGIRVLLDASLDYRTLRLAEQLVSAEPEVIKIRNLMGRNSGRYTFIEGNIVLKTRDLDRAHAVANRIETRIKEQIENVDQVLIHYEPEEREYLVYATALEDREGEKISPHFGEAPYFALVTVRADDKRALTREIISNPFTAAEHGKGILAAEMLNKHSVDVFVSREALEGKGPGYVLSASAVEVVQTGEETLEKALMGLGIGTEGLRAEGGQERPLPGDDIGKR